ncbi:MAG: prolyl oligopeptidase family serine peptidase [Lentisphaeria bacterium]|nr:prolyl oligopeptidase family serine peptidase [Lentisphaeria bacterium]
MKITQVESFPADQETLAGKYGMEQCVYKSSNGKLLKCCRREMNYDKSGKAAVLLFLHGAGERGDDNTSQLVHGAAEIIAWCEKNREKVLLLFPQCPEGMQWVDTPWGDLSHSLPPESESMALAMAALEYEMTVGEDETDAGRIYIAGISMGGYGTWDALSRHPERFAAAFPVCGGGDTAQAEKMKDIPILTYHGALDTVVPPERSRTMVDAVRKAGGRITYVELPDCNHGSWFAAFAEDNNWKWLFEQKK